MKKLMIAIALVVSIASAHAAAIKWQSGNLKDHAGNVLGYSTDYTAVVYFYSDSLGKTDISDTFKGTLSDTSADKNGQYNAATKDSGIATGTYYTKIVISGNDDGAGKGWTLTSDIVSFNYDADAISPLTINYLSGSNLSGKALTNSGTNYGWQSVPEPTSGLLLLLGVAGLALRRRRA